MMVRVLRVVWVASDLQPVALALQFVKHVKPASTAPKARACVRSASSGTADEDSDPTTECVDCNAGTYAGCGETSCTECIAGQVDSDGSPATPCTACLVGQYWEAASATNISRCVQCPVGKADRDSDSTTACEDCVVGEYCAEGTAEPVVCANEGQFDDDRDPATPCSDTDICTQVCPAGTEDDDCSDNTPCLLIHI